MQLCIDMLLKQVLRPWNILPSMHRIELKMTCKTCQKNSAGYPIERVFNAGLTLSNLCHINPFWQWVYVLWVNFRIETLSNLLCLISQRL